MKTFLTTSGLNGLFYMHDSDVDSDNGVKDVYNINFIYDVLGMKWNELLMENMIFLFYFKMNNMY